MTRAAAAMLVLGACSSPAPPTTCADLGGTYTTPDGARWMVLDNRPNAATLEIYPLFPDAAEIVAPAGMVVAPRVIDVRANGSGFAGDVLRRFAQGGDHCDARAPAHVTACTTDGLELVLADPAAPLALAPCTFAPVTASRRERWKRD